MNTNNAKSVLKAEYERKRNKKQQLLNLLQMSLNNISLETL